MMLADFWDFISNYGRLAMVLGLMIPIIAVVGYYWHQIEVCKSNNELKQRMLERGMSAEDIERVIAAGTEKERHG